MAVTATPDLCVIGAGASGIAVAEAARLLGAEVVLVEAGEPGGTDRSGGPVALRALAAAAERAALARSAPQFGITVDAGRISFRKIRDHIAGVLADAAPQNGAARLAAAGIELVRGTGSFADPQTLTVGERHIRARRFVIATGGKPVLPSIPGLLDVPYFTADTIFDNTRKLTHLVICGAGPMGPEIALSYRRLRCEVTVVEPGRALASSDHELADVALRRLRDEGVAVLEQTEVMVIRARSQGIGVDINGPQGARALDASHVMVASGRVPALEGLNLEAAQIARDRDDPRTLALNSALRTSNPRVYAVGEAAGHTGVPHLATLEADLVVRAALLGQASRFDPAAVPRFVLTDPEIAEIGLTEEVARARFRTGFSVLRASYADSPRARADRNGMGVLKLIVAPSGRILGAGVVGEGAAELAALVALAMQEQVPVARLATLAAPFPSHAALLRQIGDEANASAPPSRWVARRFALMRRLPR